MSFDYTEIAATADELLSEFGQSCTLGSVTDGAYDPAIGEAGTTTTPHPVTAAIFAYPQRYVDGTLIRTGDKRALVSAVSLTVTPKLGDKFTDAVSKQYEVIDAKEIAPAGSAVLWVLQVRK